MEKVEKVDILDNLDILDISKLSKISTISNVLVIFSDQHNHLSPTYIFCLKALELEALQSFLCISRTKTNKNLCRTANTYKSYLGRGKVSS